MNATDHPPVEDARDAEVLAAHQRQSIGMTASSPDHCSCGEAVPPEPDLTTSGPAPAIDVRRYRAFAAHQAAALAASRAVPSDQEHPCGDYPAPCNCDDPDTHDSAVPSDHTATTEDAAREWLRNYHGSIDATALLLAHQAGQRHAAGLLATARPDTTTEWGTADSYGQVYIATDEAAARYSIKDSPRWTVVRREVTDWIEADQ